jgi:type IV pilus assembly protein PilX
MMSMSGNFRRSYRAHDRQRGTVLFISLIFLVLLTLLGLTASSTSVLQERMSGGFRNNQMALMGAETALRGVEWSIWNASNGSTTFYCGATGGSSFCYQPTNVSGSTQMDPNTVTFRNSKTWLSAGAAWNTYGTTLTGLSGSETTASLANQPQYLIEDLGVVLPPGANANGEGGSRDPSVTGGATNQTLHAYRITARATGGNGGTVRAVDSYFVALPPSI